MNKLYITLLIALNGFTLGELIELKREVERQEAAHMAHIQSLMASYVTLSDITVRKETLTTE